MTLLSESDPENGTAANDFDEYGALILRFFGVHELILYFSVSLAFVLIDVFDLGLHPKVLALIKTETKKRSESSAALVQLNPRHLVDECFLCRFGSNLLMWRLQYSGDDWMGSAPYLFDIPHEWKLESRPGKVIWAQSGTAERERERERKKESGPRTRKQILKVALELIAQFLRVEGGGKLLDKSERLHYWIKSKNGNMDLQELQKEVEEVEEVEGWIGVGGVYHLFIFIGPDRSIKIKSPELPWPRLSLLGDA